MVKSSFIAAPLTATKRNQRRSLSSQTTVGDSISQSTKKSTVLTPAQSQKALFSPQQQTSHSVNCLESIKDLQAHHLFQALKHQELSLHYQPQIDLETGSFLGVEVLLRWQHPELGWISPTDFIPLAEQTRLIIPIGHWVLFQACSQYQQWMSQGIAPAKLSVNLSPYQLQQPDLVKKVRQVLEATGMSPNRLEFEITESSLVENLPKTIAILAQFKALGIQTAIDDFGTGYSSFASLKSLPFDTLKIDKSFLDDIINISKNRTILHSIIELGHRLKLKIIAEGIETVEQLNILKILNCDYGQGYFISRPPNVEGIVSFLTSAQKENASSTLSGSFA